MSRHRTPGRAADRIAHGRAFHLCETASLPFGRTAAASRASGDTDRRLPFDGGGLHAFGEVVADETRIRADNVLSFPYQEKSAGPAPSAPHAAGFALPA
ncbi:hypothetical protein [Streptomyces olivaceoviridis]|uniref:hypothetical protein n=1 Tax=Streptomyces olivaceoviridis TaxID=1921 RepID=UPI0037911A37